MKISTFIMLGILAIASMCSLHASTFTNWTEDPADPIYNPFPVSDGEDYWPYVIFNADNFDGNGDPFPYKMWHQGANPNGSIAVSYSNDGVNWVLGGETNLSPAFHAVVLYDKNGFGVGAKPYRIWYWTGVASTTDPGLAVLTSQSSDGIIWDTPVPIIQNPLSPLLDGSFFFFQLFGPGFAIFNPNATSTPGEPYSFPYVMYYDIATSVQTNQAESIVLAFSDDGIFWTRFGTQPVLIPSGQIATDWDATHLYRPSVFVAQGVYHMFYSGSNQFVDPLTTVVYAHGIGHASSPDGINWTKDGDNPIFIYSDGVAWRNTRTYTPFVLFFPFCQFGSCPTCFAKMWFTGGTGLLPGTLQGVGFATMPCPQLPAPQPPVNFVGEIIKNKFLNESELVLRATWGASPSENVIAYRIFRNDQLVAEIPANEPFVFKICICSRKNAKKFSIAAVSVDNTESVRVPIRIVKECK